MKTLNSSDMREVDTVNTQMNLATAVAPFFGFATPASVETRGSWMPEVLVPGATNAYSDGPGGWRANDSQPFTAIWGCKAILPVDADF